MESNNNTVTFNILPLLGLLFIALKLTNVIQWSWWWVLAPFWGGLAIIAVVIVVVFIAD